MAGSTLMASPRTTALRRACGALEPGDVDPDAAEGPWVVAEPPPPWRVVGPELPSLGPTATPLPGLTLAEGPVPGERLRVRVPAPPTPSILVLLERREGAWAVAFPLGAGDLVRSDALPREDDHVRIDLVAATRARAIAWAPPAMVGDPLAWEPLQAAIAASSLPVFPIRDRTSPPRST
jgi:hypothetical protein